MCCMRVRIYTLIAVTFCSYLLNYLLPDITVISWYFILINIFTCAFFIFDAYRIKTFKKKMPIFNLYYFSFIGGVFGAMCGLIITKFMRKERIFIVFQGLALVFWSCILLYLFGSNNF